MIDKLAWVLDKARAWLIGISPPIGATCVIVAYGAGIAYVLYSGGDYLDWRDSGFFDHVHGVRHIVTDTIGVTVLASRTRSRCGRRIGARAEKLRAGSRLSGWRARAGCSDAFDSIPFVRARPARAAAARGRAHGLRCVRRSACAPQQAGALPLPADTTALLSARPTC